MSENKAITVAIDGPAGAGKSTVSRRVAKNLGITYLDTGAIYRAIAWLLSEKGIPPVESVEAEKILKDVDIKIGQGTISVNGKDVSKEIRTKEIDQIVSPYAALKCVRSSLLPIQRAQAESGVVADGRDMGTTVFPDAEVKIFLTASAEERARRRCKERADRGEKADYDEILAQIIARDEYDMNREISPLCPAPGCIILDSTDMSADEVAKAISEFVAEIRKK